MKTPAIGKQILRPLAALTLANLFGAWVTSAETVRYNNLDAIPGGSDPIGSYGPLFDSFSTGANPERIVGLRLGLQGTQSPGTISVDLFDGTQFAPGQLLESLGTLDGRIVSPGNNAYTIALINSAPLAANTRYWIVLTDTGSVNWTWSFNDTGAGVTGERFGHQNTSFDNSAGAYLMELKTSSVAIPEGGHCGALLGISLVALAASRRLT